MSCAANRLAPRRLAPVRSASSAQTWSRLTPSRLAPARLTRLSRVACSLARLRSRRDRSRPLRRLPDMSTTPPGPAAATAASISARVMSALVNSSDARSRKRSMSCGAAAGAACCSTKATSNAFVQRMRDMAHLLHQFRVSPVMPPLRRTNGTPAPSDVAPACGAASPAHNTPLRVLLVPLRHVRRRHHGAAHCRDLGQKGNRLFAANARITEHTRGDDDGDHRFPQAVRLMRA